ncbi:MAG: DUF2804 domain-containing protein [Spirochaetaceae bacterium]|jgi:hypothetical protein|nr:DUF2804 domain-containing protein [Spirochaetaceae bacterium]
MYTREIQAPRTTPIENGKPLQGTWTRAFDDVDLLSIQRPFSVPLPGWIRDSRVKEWESFAVQDDNFYLDAILINLKYYRAAQVFLYEKASKERMVFKKLLPFSGWRLPRGLANASIESRSYGFFFRIHDWLDADTIRVDLNIQATRNRPAFTAHLKYDLDEKKTTPMVVTLPFSERRCMYAYKALAPVRGDMVFGGRHISLEPAKTTGIFCDFKGFYPYFTRSFWCTGLGIDAENRRIGFSIAENQTRETYKNNENALWVNGRLTPLPPVRITIPNGTEADWVVQDVEGMVDLTFTPQEPLRSALDLILTKAEYDSPLGFYNGMLMDSDGTEIPVRNLWGIGEKLYLRV